MTEEEVKCEKCGRSGWMSAVPINESATRLLVCQDCGTIYKYTKKPYKSPKIKVFRISKFRMFINRIASALASINAK